MTPPAPARVGADAWVDYDGANTDRSDADDFRNRSLLHFCADDESIAKAAQGTILDALASNACAHVFTGPGCRHAFARHRGQYDDRDAAALANARTASFFERHLR